MVYLWFNYGLTWLGINHEFHHGFTMFNICRKRGKLMELDHSYDGQKKQVVGCSLGIAYILPWKFTHINSIYAVHIYIGKGSFWNA